MTELRLLVDVSPLREHRSFRALFLGRTVLLFGVGLVLVSVPLQVYDRTGSSLAVGAVSAIEGLAFFVGFLCGGVLADRSDRWRILHVSRAFTALSFGGLALNAFATGQVWAIAVLVVVNGISAGCGITAVFALIPELVGSDKLHAIGALNTMSLRLGTMAAPPIGGVVVAATDFGWNYLAATLLALVTFPLLRRPPGLAELSRSGESPLAALRAGYRFVAGEPVVRGVMVAGIVGMLGGGSFVLVPAYVDTELGGSAVLVGLMYSAMSAGLFLGSLGSGGVRGVREQGRLLLVAMIVCFGCLVVAGASSVAVVAIGFLLAAGVVNSVEEVLRYALLQIHTPPELLGRVNSAFAAQNMSGVAVGALIAGLFGAWCGAERAFWIYNSVMAAVSVGVLIALPGLRRYRQECAGRESVGS